MEKDIVTLIQELMERPSDDKNIVREKRMQSFMWTEYMRKKLIEQYYRYRGNIRKMHFEQFPQLQLSQVRNQISSLKKAGRLQ